MALEHITEAPELDDFTALSEHQEQTPGSFFGGKPVLYLHAPGATIKVPADQYEAQPDFKPLVGSDTPVPCGGHVDIEGVDVWVTGRHLILYRPAASSGLQISYPTIALTAQQGADVLLELNLSDSDTADEDVQYVQIRILAPTIAHHAPATAEPGPPSGANGTTRPHDRAAALWQAILDCQELNPDPPAAGGAREDGAEPFDPTAPGATGWITSETLADFTDAHGNFRPPPGVTVLGGEDDDPPTTTHALGDGAGRPRTAAERDAHHPAEREPAERDHAKWQRTA